MKVSQNIYSGYYDEFNFFIWQSQKLDAAWWAYEYYLQLNSIIHRYKVCSTTYLSSCCDTKAWSTNQVWYQKMIPWIYPLARTDRRVWDDPVDFVQHLEDGVLLESGEFKYLALSLGSLISLFI